ncbi:hypothetical protein MHU86_13781 [Fragilaria crotonensis]|nr:hypothetical protein MHU86_25440 [Fragilaria crotonensis]KAI2489397.1 hypothetical protein MHU86_25199 [Fragilaria crotonensis]KAI2491672.1 hypothetical protein MHU86_22880 [Fragilaria crotonensis]KAI2492240.1 hypothetical protein MHU86_22304 [Fragilaria crotonensis]KAI2493578.1 hypothetical protein MHU86_20971 [Fragilaria crotonensis]
MNKYFTKGDSNKIGFLVVPKISIAAVVSSRIRVTRTQKAYTHRPPTWAEVALVLLAQPIVWRTVDTARRQTHLDQ